MSTLIRTAPPHREPPGLKPWLASFCVSSGQCAESAHLGRTLQNALLLKIYIFGRQQKLFCLPNSFGI
jgi:hypothetical protein